MAVLRARFSRRPPTPPDSGSGRRRHLGQSVVEFALIVPVMLMLVIAIADFGRFYMTALAVESAAREAADYGAFSADQWTSAKVAGTRSGMITRSCTAVEGSGVASYVGAADGSSCTNPTMSCVIENPSDGSSTSCDTYVDGYCSVGSNEPPCTVHTTVSYVFDTFLGLGPLPRTVTIVRDSRFVIQSPAVTP